MRSNSLLPRSRQVLQAVRSPIRCLVPVFVVGSFLTPQLAAQTVEELVSLTMEAQGGAAAFDSLASFRVTGRASSPGLGDGSFTIEWKAPNFYRTEMSLGVISVVEGYDGRRGWEAKIQNGRRALRSIEGSELLSLAANADWAEPLLRFPKDSGSVRLVRSGKKKYQLKVTHANRYSEDFYIDAKTYLPHSRSYKIYPPATDDSEEVLVSYSDYKSDSGFTLPHIIHFFYVKKQARVSLLVESVVINPELPDSLFAAPEHEVSTSRPATGANREHEKPGEALPVPWAKWKIQQWGGKYGLECDHFELERIKRMSLNAADRANQVHEKWCVQLEFACRSGSGKWQPRKGVVRIQFFLSSSGPELEMLGDSYQFADVNWMVCSGSPP